MARIRLTKTAIDKLSCEKGSHGNKYFDITLPGFGIAVSPKGKKTFFIYYGERLKRRQMQIGRYGVLTLDEARTEARKELAKVYQGRDPKEEREQKRDKMTFEEWADKYYENVSKTRKHPREDKRYLKTAKKAFGKKALDNVTTSDIQTLFNARRKQPAVANRLLATIRACLNDAWRQDIVASNPAMKIKTLPPLPPRNRVLTEAEYDSISEAIYKLDDIYTRMAFILLIETGARMSEVLRAQWQDIDFENALWHIPRPKSGKPQVMPLTDALIGEFKKLPRDGSYIIAGKDPNKPRHDLKRCWASLLKDTGLKNVRIHDLRRTFGLRITKEHGLHTASRLLRHSDIRVTERHYAPHDISELRKAMEK